MPSSRRAHRGRSRQRHLPPSSDVESEVAQVHGYHASGRDSLGSTDSSDDSDDSSDFTPTDYSSVGTSFVSASEASSTVDYREEVEEQLETGSVESRKSVIGGWFDYACGWMDRPALCLVPQDGRSSSLLRESKLKAVKAMRKVKMNGKLSEAARKVTEARELKAHQGVQQLQQDIEEAAKAAAIAVQHEKEEEERMEKLRIEQEQEQQQPNGSSRKMDDEIEEKMRKVSERASEIMKITTTEAETAHHFEPLSHQEGEQAEEDDSFHGEQDSFHEHLRQKVIETMAEENGRGNPGYAEPKLVVLGDTPLPPLGLEGPVHHEVVNVEAMHGLEDEDIQSLQPPGAKASQLDVTDLTHVEDQDVLPSAPSHDITVRRRTAAGQHDAPPHVINMNDWDDEQFAFQLSGPSRSTSNYSFDVYNSTEDFMPVNDKQSLESRVINLWNEEERKVEAKAEEAREEFDGLRSRRHGIPSPERARPPRTTSRRRELQPEEVSSGPISHRLAKRAHSPVVRRKLESVGARASRPESWTPPRSADREQNDQSLELRRRAMASQPRGLGDHYTLDKLDRTSNRSTVSLVAVRSVDEAQRTRKPKNRTLDDKTVHPSKQKKKESEIMQYGIKRTSSRDNPIDVEKYMVDPSTVADASVEQPRDRKQHSLAREVTGLPTQSKLPPLGPSSNDAKRERPSQTSRETNNYNNLVVNRTNISMPRERNYDFVDVSSMMNMTNRMQSTLSAANRSRSRGHDMRDDQEDVGYKSSRSLSGQTPYDEQEPAGPPIRRNRTTEELSPSDELRKLEKRLTKQLMHVKREPDTSSTWDERSAVSSKHLRTLEKKLVQTLRKEDEKRAAKLRRLRNLKQNRKSMSSEVSTVDFAKDDQVVRNVVVPATPEASDLPPPPRRERTNSEAREGRSKYDQLRVLRNQRPMHKYMHRSS